MGLQTNKMHSNLQRKHFQNLLKNDHILHSWCMYCNDEKVDTVNDLFSASALVTAPYLFSKQHTGQLLVGGRLDSDSVQSRLVTKG